MDLGLVHGIWSLVILIFFIGIVAFVWHRDRRRHYDEAAQIPFDKDDDNQHRRSQDENE